MSAKPYNWIENKPENWPADQNDKDLYLFVQFSLNKYGEPMVITDYYGTWESAKYFRKFELERTLNSGYTHFIKITPPLIPTKNE